MEYTEFLELVLALPAVAAEQGEKQSFALLDGALRELAVQRAGLTAEQDRVEMEEFRRLLLPAIRQSGFCGYVYDKPRGYPGDFVTQEMIWSGRTLRGEHRYLGATPLGKLLSALTFDMANCRANEQRILRLEKRVRAGGTRLASIGCGSCIELWRQQGMESYDVLLLDQDAGALACARKGIGSSIGAVRYVEQNVLRFALKPGRDLPLGDRDLVYAFGLLDYFDEPSAARLVKGLWQLVAPGGCLLVTNAHPNNPTRLWMEYGGDWMMKYKDAMTMRTLAESLRAVATTELILDDEGVYQFLEIRKEG